MHRLRRRSSRRVTATNPVEIIAGQQVKNWYTTVFTAPAKDQSLSGREIDFTIIDDVMAPSEWKETGNTVIEFT